MILVRNLSSEPTKKRNLDLVIVEPKKKYKGQEINFAWRRKYIFFYVTKQISNWKSFLVLVVLVATVVAILI